MITVQFDQLPDFVLVVLTGVMYGRAHEQYAALHIGTRDGGGGMQGGFAGPVIHASG